MSYKLEPTSDVHRRIHATSFLGEQMLEIGVAQPPAEAGFVLPERYNIPLFEVLVVDTDYLFISWEITQEQQNAAQQVIGEKAFHNRRLKVRFHDALDGNALLLERELYGEVGRWFLHFSRPGTVVTAQLGFVYRNAFHSLYETGTLSIPRVQLIEPESYDELEVSYGFGLHGRLMLLGTHRHADAPWPETYLPEPFPEHYVMPRLPAGPEQDSRGLVSRLPSSAEHGVHRPNSSSNIDVSSSNKAAPSLPPEEQ